MRGFSAPIAPEDIIGINTDLNNKQIKTHPIIIFEDYSGSGYYFLQARSKYKYNAQGEILFQRKMFLSEIECNAHSDLTSFFEHPSYIDLAKISYISKADFKQAFPNTQVIFLDNIYTRQELNAIFTKLIKFFEAEPPYLALGKATWKGDNLKFEQYYLSYDLMQNYWKNDSVLKAKSQNRAKQYRDYFNNNLEARLLFNDLILVFREMMQYFYRFNLDFNNLNPDLNWINPKGANIQYDNLTRFASLQKKFTTKSRNKGNKST